MSERTATGSGSGLRPLSAPRPLAEDAADRIREQILSGGFRQGDHLVEAKIAQQLTISRGPVREAFKLLRAEGLLEEEPRRGTFVVSLTSEDVREIYGLRAALEGSAARLLTRTQDRAALERLRALAADIESAVETGEGVATSRADLAFHEELCRSCGNARIYEVFMRYVPTLRGLLRLDERVVRSLGDVALQHRPMLEVIESGDEDQASATFGHHCEQAGDLIADYIAGLPEQQS